MVEGADKFENGYTGVRGRGVARNLFWGIKVFGDIKLLNSSSDVIFTP